MTAAEMLAKATTGPWVCADTERENEPRWFVWGAPSAIAVADVETEADARLIVHAVNNYERLRDALAGLLNHFDGPTRLGSCQTCWLPADEANDQCREHVARAALQATGARP